jgi:hypothetical protein
MDNFYRFPTPYRPIRIDNYIPVYTTAQIDMYGFPDYYGVVCYTVIQEHEDVSPMVMDYQMEQERRGALRPIHYYDRIERFTSTLYQLIGCRGKVPEDVIETIKETEYSTDPLYIWDSVRDILKTIPNGRKYYNRIPTILSKLGYKHKIDFQDQDYIIKDICLEFRKINAKYELIKSRLEGRKYFPSLRFIAFKLLEKHGAEFQYRIPFVRTPRKQVLLESIWDEISFP